MKDIAIFYGSTTGNTESAAKTIAEKLNADIYDVSEKPIDKIKDYKNLIFGTSTWGAGDLQDDWEGFITELAEEDLTDKTVALFGLGDSASYSDTFVDGIGIIYKAIKDKGCKFVGAVSKDQYSYDASEAESGDKFIGLALDEDNEDNLTEERINSWVEQLKSEF